MAKIPFDIVGFDLDGTLLDTSGDLAAAVNYTLAQIGRPPFSVEEIKPLVGRGAKVMLERGLEVSGGSSDELMQKYRSEEHTSELQSLMRISYAVFCLKKKKQH